MHSKFVDHQIDKLQVQNSIHLVPRSYLPGSICFWLEVNYGESWFQNWRYWNVGENNGMKNFRLDCSDMFTTHQTIQ